MRRAGFTMIAVVFVIVILGIISSVAMTKIVGTRTDALVSNTLSDFNTAIKDFSGYYTANGRFDIDITQTYPLQKMTAVNIIRNGDFYQYLIDGQQCFSFKEFSDGGRIVFNKM